MVVEPLEQVAPPRAPRRRAPRPGPAARARAGASAASRSWRRCASGSRPACAAFTTCSTLSGPADVAGVDPDGGDAGVDRPQREARVEVDVRDHRDRREADDLRQRVRVLDLRDRAAHDLAAGGRERRDLRRRRLDVVRLRQRHRLHDDGRAAADLHVADPDRALARHQFPRLPMSFERPMKKSSSTTRDPDRGDALVDLTADRAAADALDQREDDVAAVERQQRQQVQQRERQAEQAEHPEVRLARPASSASDEPCDDADRARDLLPALAVHEPRRATRRSPS